jgi:hypothetical protein
MSGLALLVLVFHTFTQVVYIFVWKEGRRVPFAHGNIFQVICEIVILEETKIKM